MGKPVGLVERLNCNENLTFGFSHPRSNDLVHALSPFLKSVAFVGSDGVPNRVRFFLQHRIGSSFPADPVFV